MFLVILKLFFFFEQIHLIGVWFKMLFKLHTSAKLVTLGSSVKSLSLRCSRGLKNPARNFSQKAEQVRFFSRSIICINSKKILYLYDLYDLMNWFKFNSGTGKFSNSLRVLWQIKAIWNDSWLNVCVSFAFEIQFC